MRQMRQQQQADYRSILNEQKVESLNNRANPPQIKLGGGYNRISNSRSNASLQPTPYTNAPPQQMPDYGQVAGGRPNNLRQY